MIKTLFTGRKLLATLIVIAGVAVNFSLGLWQYDRHRQREALNARVAARMAEPAIELHADTVDPAALDHRRVTVQGRYDPAQEVVLRNRAYDGEVGVHVLTPLRLASGSAVLIDRGWLPMAMMAPEMRRSYPPPPGEVQLSGVALQSQANAAGPKDPPLPPGETRRDAWFRVDTQQISQQTGYPLLPVFIELQPEPGAPPLPARSPTTGLGPGSHLGYTFQWFSFGIIMLVGYLVWSYQQLRRGGETGRQEMVEIEDRR